MAHVRLPGTTFCENGQYEPKGPDPSLGPTWPGSATATGATGAPIVADAGFDLREVASMSHTGARVSVDQGMSRYGC